MYIKLGQIIKFTLMNTIMNQSLSFNKALLIINILLRLILLFLPFYLENFKVNPRYHLIVFTNKSLWNIVLKNLRLGSGGAHL